MVSAQSVPNPEEITIAIQQLKLTAKVYGDDRLPVMIALHGWLDNAESFYQLAPLLNGYKVISVDLAGHGQSDHRPGCMPYDIWDNVNDLYQLVERLGLTQVKLIGHSMGASIAMMFACCFPDKVTGLYLIDGLAPLTYEAAEQAEKLAQGIVKRQRFLQRKLPCYNSVEQMIEVRGNGRFEVSREAAQKLVMRGHKSVEDGFTWSSDPALMLPSMVRFTEPQVDSLVTSVVTPTKLFIAEQGLATERWQRWAQMMADCQVITLPGNHHFHMELAGAQAIARQILIA